jgi:hypothetical protein
MHMIKTCSFAASALITLAIVVGFSTPVAAAQPGATAPVAIAAQPLPPIAAGCCVLA